MAFPATPANNQTYTSTSGERYIFITDRWKKISLATGQNDPDFVSHDSQTLGGAAQDQAKLNAGITENGPHKQTLITVSGTHTFDANTRYAIVYLQAGGGGGAAANSTGTTSVTGTCGGSGGSCAAKLIYVNETGVTSAEINIGAGGAGGTTYTSTPGDAGEEGNPTEYFDDVVYFAAAGGYPSDLGFTWGSYGFNPGKPGRCGGSNADWIHPGGPSGPGIGNGDNAVTTGFQRSSGGHGGGSFFGMGGEGSTEGNNTAQIGNGRTGGARGYGYGGSSACAIHNGSGGVGADGGDGCALIVEYR